MDTSSATMLTTILIGVITAALIWKIRQEKQPSAAALAPPSAAAQQQQEGQQQQHASAAENRQPLRPDASSVIKEQRRIRSEAAPAPSAGVITVYRATSDETSARVLSQGGFVYPSNATQYAAGKGGLYFSTSVEDVIFHSTSLNGGKHYFKCVVPGPTARVVLDADNRLDVMRTATTQDTLFYQVQYGAIYRNEYVKAGQEGELFAPYELELVMLHD